MPSSPTTDHNFDHLVTNPGFRMSMNCAARSDSPVPEIVLKRLVQNPHFETIFLEATKLEKAPYPFLQEHFDRLAEDPRIEFLLKELLGRHLRLRDQIKAAGRWSIETLRAWVERILKVRSQDDDKPVPDAPSAPRTSIATILTTLLVGGGTVMAHNAWVETHDFKSQYNQEQRRLESDIRNSVLNDQSRFATELSRIYRDERQDFERSVREDIDTRINHVSSDVDSKIKLSSTTQIDKKINEEVFRKVRSDVSESIKSEVSQTIDPRLRAVETRVQNIGYSLPPVGCSCSTGGKEATTLPACLPAAWTACCCKELTPQTHIAENTPPKDNATPLCPCSRNAGRPIAG